MGLSESENVIYQQVLKHATEISLNLMAVKVEHRPEDFTAWCYELHRLCRDGLNYDLLEPEQLPVVKKLQLALEKGISSNQLKMLRITPWPFFAAYIEERKTQISYDERIRLLRHIDGIKQTPLQELTELDRQSFSGKHTANHDPAVYDFDVEWFSSTKGARHFQNIFEQRPAEFQQALAHIPLEGEVTESHYMAFVKTYREIFSTDIDGQPSTDKAPLFPATRLLAMYRPDQFVAATAPKMDLLCVAIGCAKVSNDDFSGYWQEVIETIRTCPWWTQSEPEIESEKELWRYRAAFIDAFYFADDNSPAESNFVKLKERIASGKKPALKSAGGRKRTKETAEQIVDRRLEDPELPAYLKGRRDSLVHEVKNGKSVDEAIMLFRAIFG